MRRRTAFRHHFIHVDPERFVPVSRHKRTDDQVAGLDLLPAQREVDLRQTRERHLYDGEVAQQLLDQVRDLLLVPITHQRDVVRVFHQHMRGERDHRRRRLMPAGEDAIGQSRELNIRDRVAFSGDDLPDEAIVGIFADLLDQAAQILQRLADLTERVGRVAGEVEPVRAVLLELVAFGIRHAEQIADDQGRDRHRVVLDQVGALPSPLHLVELAVHDAVDLGHQPAQPAHCEFRRQDLAQP